MKTTMKMLAIALLVAACGDNKEVPDAKVNDGAPGDAYCSDCPAAPALGTQIDRLGRATANTVLNHGFDGTAAAGPAKDAYNADGTASGWVTANTGEFMKNMAVLDSLDTGMCGNGLCEINENGTTCAADCTAAGTITTGCGNQPLYNGGVGTTPGPTSYQALASVLAADELYLDTSRSQCGLYLAVEFGAITGGGNTTCGGRMPQYDVIDFSLTVLTMGIAGFSTDGTFTPELGDGTPKHTDYLAAFPYLGEPH